MIYGISKSKMVHQMFNSTKADGLSRCGRITVSKVRIANGPRAVADHLKQHKDGMMCRSCFGGIPAEVKELMS